jgi:predicted metal-binding membrane protein
MSAVTINQILTRATSFFKAGLQKKGAVFRRKTETLLLKNPQWRTWSLSLAAWAMLFVDFFEKDYWHHSLFAQIIDCGQATTPQFSPAASHFLVDLTVSIARELPSWSLMIIAMMFPLLNEPVKHVAHSVKGNDRNKAVFYFLSGYSMVWLMFGVSILALLQFFGRLDRNWSPWTIVVMRSCGFLLAMGCAWLPSRPVKMAKCSQTAPIRIQGMPLLVDALCYGWKMGRICVNVCWAPMTAMILYGHNAFLMYVLTIVLIYERYLLPHTSKISGSIWAAVGLLLFGTETIWG